jgi:hypothetical protein
MNQPITEALQFTLVAKVHGAAKQSQFRIGRFKLGFECFQAVLPTGDQDHGADRRGKLTSKLAPNSGRGSGNQDGATGEIADIHSTYDSMHYYARRCHEKIRMGRNQIGVSPVKIGGRC